MVNSLKDIIPRSSVYWRSLASSLMGGITLISLLLPVTPGPKTVIPGFGPHPLFIV